MIEAAQIYRPRIATQSAFAPHVEINMEVAQSQFAECPVNRSSVAATDKVRGRDCTPMAAGPVYSDDMIDILLRLQVEDERGISEDAKCRRGKSSAFQAVHRSFF